MLVTRCDWEKIERALAHANKEYDGNLCFRNSAYGNESGAMNGKRRNRVTLGVVSSKLAGHRASCPIASGIKARNMAYACWHAHRDFLGALFDLEPSAWVKTAFAYYKGRDVFEREFMATFHRNAGSQMNPVDYGRLCECEAGLHDD